MSAPTSIRPGIKSNLMIKKKLCLVAYSLAILSTTGKAQTLDQEIRSLLAQGENGFCSQLVGNSPLIIAPSNMLQPINFGPQLATLCERPQPVPPPPPPPPGEPSEPPPPVSGGTGGGGGGAGGTSQTPFSGSASSNLGQADQFVKKRRLKTGKDENKNIPIGGGDDAELAIASRINVFFNADYRELDRRQTILEPGYQSNQKGFNLGADLMPTDWLITGLTFNYSRWRGDQLSTGGFEADSYGTTVFASLFPWKGFFADLSFQYSHRDGSNNNQRNYAREDNTNFGGSITGSPNADQYEGNLTTGFDYSIGGFTIGPRATARYRHVGLEGYTERGNSGLELRFLPDQFNSVQSSIGAQASFAISTVWGVLVPQLNADWTHEYDNGQRLIFVQFAQDHRAIPTTFGFQTDRPDRDFFHLGTGVVAVLPEGWQAFANFETLLGNAYFDNYVGTVGLRLGL